MEINTYCVKCKRRSPVVEVKIGDVDNPVHVTMQLCYECFEKDFAKDANNSVYYLDSDEEDFEANDFADELDNTFASH